MKMLLAAMLTVCLLALSVLSVVSSPVESDEVHSRVKRVIGGDEIQVGDWPYLVHLNAKVPSETLFGFAISHRRHYCGGSIVDKRWILSAAHCFNGTGFSGTMIPKYWHVTAGETSSHHDVLDTVINFFGQMFEQHDMMKWYLHAEKIIIHPDYDERDNWRNDIALIKLEEDLPVGDEDPNIGVIELPTQGEVIWPTTQEECVMKGWGCTELGGRVQSQARVVQLPYVENDLCSTLYRPINLDFNTGLCAGHNLESMGICKGDSGGPLVCRGGDGFENHWVQAGIASFTSARNPGEVPGVFTRVSAYIDWIRQTIAYN